MGSDRCRREGREGGYRGESSLRYLGPVVARGEYSRGWLYIA